MQYKDEIFRAFPTDMKKKQKTMTGRGTTRAKKERERETESMEGRDLMISAWGLFQENGFGVDVVVVI